MIEISFWKLALLFVIATIFLGPQQLTKTAKTVGRLIGKINQFLKNTHKDLYVKERDKQAADQKEKL